MSDGKIERSNVPEEYYRVRQTPTERNHELLKLALERPAPVSGQPSFKISQEKAVGGATVFTWDVHVPVCEEYPTAEKAFSAALDFASELNVMYGPPEHADLAKQLRDSVKPGDKPRRVK